MSVCDLPVVIHPGFVKTATKTLQLNLFAHHPDVLFLGWPAPSPQLERATRAILYDDSEEFDEERIATEIQQFCETAPSRRVAVLSHENFALYEATDRGVVARRLAALFPHARILFTIRRQEDLLTSWYLQKLRKYAKGNHYLTFKEWIRLKKKEPHRSILSNLDYSRTILYYARLFGQERVLVLPFEFLLADISGFAAAIAGWLEIDPVETERLLRAPARNTAPTNVSTGFYRYFAPFIPRRLSRKLGEQVIPALPIGRKLKVEIDPETQNLVRELCAEGNQRLERTFKLDLGRYNYVLPERMPQSSVE
jgi:hypothetical protein